MTQQVTEVGMAQLKELLPTAGSAYELWDWLQESEAEYFSILGKGKVHRIRPYGLIIYLRNLMPALLDRLAELEAKVNEK